MLLLTLFVYVLHLWLKKAIIKLLAKILLLEKKAYRLVMYISVS
jgi:hypothetical protein